MTAQKEAPQHCRMPLDLVSDTLLACLPDQWLLNMGAMAAAVAAAVVLCLRTGRWARDGVKTTQIHVPRCRTMAWMPSSGEASVHESLVLNTGELVLCLNESRLPRGERSQTVPSRDAMVARWHGPLVLSWGVLACCLRESPLAKDGVSTIAAQRYKKALVLIL